MDRLLAPEDFGYDPMDGVGPDTLRVPWEVSRIAEGSLDYTWTGGIA